MRGVVRQLQHVKYCTTRHYKPKSKWDIPEEEESGNSILAIKQKRTYKEKSQQNRGNFKHIMQ
jgi:hypothetical protein